jgi:hypothetical protein
VAHVYGATGGERDFCVGGDEDEGGCVLGEVEWCQGGPWDAGFVNGLAGKIAWFRQQRLGGQKELGQRKTTTHLSTQAT